MYIVTYHYKENKELTIFFSNLSRNPWRCDCDLLWVKTWLMKQNASTDNQNIPFCTYPKAASILSLRDKEMLCGRFCNFILETISNICHIGGSH